MSKFSIDVKVSGKTVRKNKMKYLEKSDKSVIYKVKIQESFGLY